MRRIHDMCGSQDFFMGVTWRQGLEPQAGMRFYKQRTDRANVAPNVRRHEALDFVVLHDASEKEFRVETCLKGAPLKSDRSISQAVSQAASHPVCSSQTLDDQNPSLKLAKASDIFSFLQKLSLARKTKSLPVSSWMQDAPVAAGIRAVKDAHRRIREALESLAKSQRLHIHKKSGERWDPTNWIVELPS